MPTNTSCASLAHLSKRPLTNTSSGNASARLADPFSGRGNPPWGAQCLGTGQFSSAHDVRPARRVARRTSPSFYLYTLPPYSSPHSSLSASAEPAIGYELRCLFFLSFFVFSFHAPSGLSSDRARFARIRQAVVKRVALCSWQTVTPRPRQVPSYLCVLFGYRCISC